MSCKSCGGGRGALLTPTGPNKQQRVFSIQRDEGKKEEKKKRGRRFGKYDWAIKAEENSVDFLPHCSNRSHKTAQVVLIKREPEPFSLLSARERELPALQRVSFSQKLTAHTHPEYFSLSHEVLLKCCGALEPLMLRRLSNFLSERGELAVKTHKDGSALPSSNACTANLSLYSIYYQSG